ncbi:MAG: hypothetical protein KAJ73_03225 [Zetaproteobacteria bacterium]|nr:hypothetical protein [Zetaproteobacteria bacterium]
MPAVISRGLPEEFSLDLPEGFDPDGDTMVTVKPATVAENSIRDELWAKQKRTYNAETPSAMTVESESTYSQRQATEVFLTLVDCNIEFQAQDKSGEPKGDPKALFKFGKKGSVQYLAMVRDDFLDAWGKLPQVVADEIHRCVLLKNPQWDLFRVEPEPPVP